MDIRFALGIFLLAFTFSGCSKKPDAPDTTAAAEQKVAEAEKQLAAAKTELQAAKSESSAAQRVAELEKQLAEAKQQAEASKAAGAPAAKADAPPPPPPPPPKPKVFTLAAGTPISVRTTTALSTKTQQTGDPFSASLSAPLAVDGEVLAPAGAEVTGVVALSDPGGKVKGKASISVTLKSIQGKHGPMEVATNSHGAVAASSVKKDVTKGAIMTGVGAAIGAIAGGGKGAAIGAGIGGAAGVGTAMATKGNPASIPAESAITFTLKAPVTVTVQP